MENSALAQKARINWIQQGDENSTFFYASVKDRNARGRVDLLYDDQGQCMENTEDLRELYSASIRNCLVVRVMGLKRLILLL